MIYIVSPFESPLENRGTRNMVLAKKLADSNESIKFITTNFSHQMKSTFKEDLVLSLKNDMFSYKVINAPVYKNNLSIKRLLCHWVIAFKIHSYLSKKIKNDDIIIISSIPPEVLFLLSFFTKNKVKIHLDIRDIWPDAFPGRGLIRKLFEKYCNLLYNNSLSCVSSYTYVAPKFKSWFKKMNKNPSSLCINEFIPLGFDKERWKTDNSKNNIIDKEFINIVYIGYLESQFPLYEIINIVNNSERIKLHVIGDGSKYSFYKKNSGDNIIFHGRLKPQDVVSVCKTQDIGILPISGTAELPNKIFDYIGAGLPILHLGSGDAKSFIVDNGFGWSFNISELYSIESFLEKLSHHEIRNIKFNIESKGFSYSKDVIYEKFVSLLLRSEK